MKRVLDRRELLGLAAFAASGAALETFLKVAAAAEPVASPRKRALFFTKSSGFQHSVITRPKDDPNKLAYAEQILTDLGASNGFDVVCSKDGRVFTTENIRGFDVFVFYTTGDLTTDSDHYDTKKNAEGKDEPDKTKLLLHEPAMPPCAKEAFLDAIRGGKGFVGFHSATDTFHSPAHNKGEMLRNVDERGNDAFDPYIRMLGGEFIVHGKQQDGRLVCVDKSFPGAAALDSQSFTEEWYSLKNFSQDLHVILAQDCAGMNGAMYQRPPFPETWARMHGSGRVFYTSMGHREDVWQKPEFRGLIVGALNWASRRVDVPVPPNIKDATPRANLQEADLPPTTQKGQ
jgi:uncharacterized protein